MFDIQKIYEPKTVDEALHFLENDEKSMVISGGTDVLIKIREGRISDAILVSLFSLQELKGISIDQRGSLIIGGGASFTDVENHPLIKEHVDFLGFSSSQVGGPQIRNMGTVGGNICNGAPSADTCAPLLALNALLHLRSAAGERILPMSEFYLGPGKTKRERHEILTHFEIPLEHYQGFKGSYFKYAMRKAMDIATLSCCVMSRLSQDRATLDDVKITYGVAAPTPISSPKLQGFLKGQKVGSNLMEIIDKNYDTDVNPRDSWRASKAFRLDIIKEVTKRNLAESIEKGGGIHVYHS